ncbi:MAG: hypothetical protein ABMA01_12940 [Chthoniobacteraceae bacterium]
MKTATRTDDDIREEGFAILRERLGRGGFTRFLRSIFKSEGNYTAERHRMLGRQTVAEICADIKAGRRKPKSK